MAQSARIGYSRIRKKGSPEPVGAELTSVDTLLVTYCIVMTMQM